MQKEIERKKIDEDAQNEIFSWKKQNLRRWGGKKYGMK